MSPPADLLSLAATLGQLARSGVLARLHDLAPEVELQDLGELQQSGAATLARAVVQALEAVSTAAFLVDGGGRVLAMTAAAERLGRAHQLLVNAVDEPALCRAARRALEPLAPGGAGESRLIIDSAEGPVLLEARSLEAEAAALLIVVARHPSTREPLEGRVRAAFGLTTAEAQVAAALCEGRSPDEIAELRGVSVGTVRAQLKELFGKTETNRQSQLVSLLLAYA